MNKLLKQNFPKHGWIGLGLVVIFWFLNWNLEGLRTHILFFPLWLGYALTVDALTFFRKGSSLYKRNKKKYFSLFLISAPAWWLFEIFNLRTQNWFYDGKQYFTEVEYALYATLSFSTVIPSVFGTAELVSTLRWIRNIKSGIRFLPSKQNLLILFSLGWIMLSLLLIWPEYFFVFVWISMYFILEPINVWLKNHSLFEYVSVGEWGPVFSLWIGCFICGFFWEMWNYLSYPKWTYDIHFANVLHVFEMPLPGYLGYIPFSIELYALYHIVTGFTKFKKDNFIQFV